MNELTEKRSIDTITAEIQIYKQQAGVAILEIGKRLIEAKEQLGHGEWLPWLKEKVDFSEANAQRFMQLARNYENPATLRDLGPSKALALLAVPAEEREEFAEAVHAEEISVRELKAKIQERDEIIRAQKADLDAKRQTINMQTKSLDSLTEEYQEQVGFYDRLKTEYRELEGLLAARETALEQTEAALQRAREEPVVTIDATEEQIKAAEERGRSFAQWELDTTKRQLGEQVQKVGKLQTRLDEKTNELKRLREEAEDASEDVVINQSLGKISSYIALMQSTNQSITELLGTLDALSRQRVQGTRRKLLKRMLEDIK